MSAFASSTPSTSRGTPLRSIFTERMARLLAFRDKYGHCRVPGHYPDQRLASFVRSARTRRQQRRLPARRVAALDAIGFSWNTARGAFLPSGWPGCSPFRTNTGIAESRDTIPINGWLVLSGQRSDPSAAEETFGAPRRGVGCHRICLSSPRTDWAQPANWAERVAQLRAFSNEPGRCRIPNNYPDQRLASFITRSSRPEKARNASRTTHRGARCHRV